MSRDRPHRSSGKDVVTGLVGIVALSTVAGVLVAATVTPALVASSTAATASLELFDSLPSYLELDPLMEPTTLFAKTSTGEDVVLTQFYDQNRAPIDYGEIPPVLHDAILSSEDPRYYEHGGVDLIGTTRAFIQNFRGGSLQGGSSISQQYVKNILIQRCESDADTAEQLEACWSEATVSSGTEGPIRKLREMRYAIALEQRYSKNDVLLGYLNIANFGGSTYGIGAAARHYFSTDVMSLTLVQAATLAGMVQNPNALRIDQPDREYNGLADGYVSTLDRRNCVLGRMLDDGKITQEQHKQAAETPIEPVIAPSQRGCAAAIGMEYFCDFVRTVVENDPTFGATAEERQRNLRRGGYQIHTTIDLDLQQAAREAISIVPATHPDIDLGAAGVQLEVGTGRVLSMVQNRAYTQDADLMAADSSYTAINYNTRYVNGGSTGKEPGSTYKLFTLLNWLENGHSVNEAINGQQRTFTIRTGCDGDTSTHTLPVDQVGNFDGVRGYTGTPTRFTADSLNTGFLAMSERVSVCDTNRLADRLGVELAGGGKTYDENVPYDVLGSKSVAPIDMAGAYATVASGGTHCNPRAIDRVTDSAGNELPALAAICTPPLAPNVAAAAAYALETVITGGSATASRIGDGIPVIGKTGTHQQSQTWMDGSSTKVTTVVWVGNVQGQARLDLITTNDIALWRLRHEIWPAMQGAANAKYGGDEFPEPDTTLTRQVLVDLPDVTSLPTDQAARTLAAAGFSVTIGDPIDDMVAAGHVASQTPAAGRMAPGTTVHLTPSTGEGRQIPSTGGKTTSEALDLLAAAGFTDPILGVCTIDPLAPIGGRTTEVSPSEGATINRHSRITIGYRHPTCT